MFVKPRSSDFSRIFSVGKATRLRFWAPWLFFFFLVHYFDGRPCLFSSASEAGVSLSFNGLNDDVLSRGFLSGSSRVSRDSLSGIFFSASSVDVSVWYACRTHVVFQIVYASRGSHSCQLSASFER